jgi:2-polyprenyl-6-hydroxyphenyl methylase/3-demethylubiquinone-9 3-methyltransferase
MNQHTLSEQYQREVLQGRRFRFGANWQQFAKGVDSATIDAAQCTLKTMLDIDQWEHIRFLDIGSGSGVFSVAARLLGAAVYSFDYDPQSVDCTAAMKRQHVGNDADWIVEQGTILDQEYIASLGQFDVVYAWGVLHHTGDMWHALENACSLVGIHGKLFISIYNDQRWVSSYWRIVKHMYNRHWIWRIGGGIAHLPLLLARVAVRGLTGRLRLGRGMSLWHDYIDWLGGYPFEVAKPEAVLNFCRKRGFDLVKLKTCGGRSGCNEYVFERRMEYEKMGD